MDSLYRGEHRDTMLQRIASLRPDSSPAWGKMNGPQMLAHCQVPLEIALGEIESKRSWIGFLFGKSAKRKFVDGERPFGKNSPTDPRFLNKEASDFEGERAKLVALVTRFTDPSVVTRAPHPFFGPLTTEDWDRLMWKHLDHHLRQFGA